MTIKLMMIINAVIIRMQGAITAVVIIFLSNIDPTTVIFKCIMVKHLYLLCYNLQIKMFKMHIYIYVHTNKLVFERLNTELQ